MFPIEKRKMKPERSEVKELGFFFNVRLGGLADMVQVVQYIQWSLPHTGFAVKSVHFEDNELEVHCVGTASQDAE